ncbi:MAG TPA: hypothetical protein PLD27_06995 [bacterium]|nr:hypothetical protein [bacterium]HOL48400.1 hypothetical protein [bacterium]HPQ18880.1 hypothetical protein [bacterium]
MNISKSSIYSDYFEQIKKNYEINNNNDLKTTNNFFNKTQNKNKIEIDDSEQNNPFNNTIYKFLINRVKYAKIKFNEKKNLIKQIIFLFKESTDEKVKKETAEKINSIIMLKENFNIINNKWKKEENLNNYEYWQLEKYIKKLEKESLSLVVK